MNHHHPKYTLSKLSPNASVRILPPVPNPPKEVLEALGEAAIVALTRRWHGRLKASAIGFMYADGEGFERGVYGVSAFLIQAMGGPDRFAQEFGDPMLPKRHQPFPIDQTARDLWLAELKNALNDCAVPEALQKALIGWLSPFSLRLINR